MKKIIILIASSVLLLLLAACVYDNINPYDPENTSIETPNYPDFNYEKNVGTVYPNYIEIKWDRSTEDDFYFYAIARSSTPITIPDEMGSKEEKIITELKQLDSEDFWESYSDPAYISENLPTFSATFNVITLLPDANVNNFWDENVQPGTGYYYTLLIFSKNLVTYNYTAQLYIETPPNLWDESGTILRECELLFPHRDLPQACYDIKVDGNGYIYISGYSFGINYNYYTNVNGDTNGQPINNYYIVSRSVNDAFGIGQIWEEHALVMSEANIYPNAEIGRIMGFAVDNSYNMYIPDLKYPDWSVNVLSNWGTSIADTGFVQSTNIYIDDFSKYVYYDTNRDWLWISGDDIRIVNAADLEDYGTFDIISNSSSDRISGITMDANDNIFVCESEQNYIYKLEHITGDTWSFAAYFTGLPGSKNGQLKDPHGIACDSQGNVYVADTGNNRIQKFDSDGYWVSTWDLAELLGNGALEPRALFIKNDVLYVGCKLKIYEIQLP
jgi:hypothetical protein